MRMKRKNFSQTAGVRPGRTLFDLSYSKTFDMEMGQIIPIMCEECVPGDKWSIGNEIVVRLLPLVSPVLHQIGIKVDYFFMPYRLIWTANNPTTGSWVDFVTGEVDGDNSDTPPTWEPTDTSECSLWDYFGFPIDVDPDGAYPLSFPKNAYNLIWNEYFRDEQIQTEVNMSAENILYSNWTKDYFTSCLESQQRGTQSSFPVAGSTSAEWESSILMDHDDMTTPVALPMIETDDNTTPYFGIDDDAAPGTNARTNWLNAINTNTVDLSAASTFDVTDLRYAVQVQRWMERNNRCGVRYTEFLNGHFGVSPRDERLDRPEYLGGTRSSIITSEVLAHTEDSGESQPLGALGGHGISVSKDYCCSYFVQEYGLIIGLMRIMPKPVYHQGINRQWLRETRYDFYSPEFANLSEQAVIRAEIYADGVSANNQTIFGYQGMFDEMRTKHDMVCGHFHPGENLDYWNLARDFPSAPSLNTSFLKCDPDTRIFAQETYPNFLVQFGNRLKALRPLPYMSNPGLVDHV